MSCYFYFSIRKGRKLKPAIALKNRKQVKFELPSCFLDNFVEFTLKFAVTSHRLVNIIYFVLFIVLAVSLAQTDQYYGSLNKQLSYANVHEIVVSSNQKCNLDVV